MNASGLIGQRDGPRCVPRGAHNVQCQADAQLFTSRSMVGSIQGCFQTSYWRDRMPNRVYRAVIPRISGVALADDSVKGIDLHFEHCVAKREA